MNRIASLQKIKLSGLPIFLDTKNLAAAAGADATLTEQIAKMSVGVLR